jgi:hypothetical protein
LALSDLAAARKAQRGDEVSSCGIGGRCGGELPVVQLGAPPAHGVTAPEANRPLPEARVAVPPPTAEPEDPELPRLRDVARVLADKGIEARLSGTRLELSFRDEGQPDNVSTVVVARVSPDTRCFARSGDLGLWYSGKVATPRILRVLKAVRHLLG